MAEPTLAPNAGQHGRQAGAVAPAAPTPAPAWGAVRWLGFRFVLVYLLIYNLPVAASWVPGTGWVVARYQGLWAAAVPWVGRHVLHLARPIAAVPNGSGDRTFDFLQILCMAALSALAALAWTALDRRPGRERALAEGLRIYLRYTLALVLLTRGIGMLTGVRFPFPGIDRLQERLGDSSR